MIKRQFDCLKIKLRILVVVRFGLIGFKNILLLFCRRKERQVLEKGGIRRTPYAGDVGGHHTTFRSASVLSVDILGRSFVTVSNFTDEKKFN